MQTQTQEIAHPKVVSMAEWEAARKEHLAKEKALTKQADQLRAERRRLPMVKVEKEYLFDSPDGKVRLLDLFDGKQQLIVYHFMFDPTWDEGCPGCTGLVKEIGDLSTLGERNTRMVLVSRAPLAKLEAYKQRYGWTLPWVSSLDSDFNYDFHVTLDEAVAPVEYNFETKAEIEAKRGKEMMKGEAPGLSVFFRIDDQIFLAYSTFARGLESLTDSYALLDVTPYGRQEDWEDSPAGWPQRPTYG